jgi:DNA-directed RNA polymerase subunit RPC12/RpoP
MFVEEQVLHKCSCGGEVNIFGGTYDHPTFGIKCNKCGGKWLTDSDSPLEAFFCWEIRAKEFD